MNITINNNKEEVTYYNKDTYSIYNQDNIVRLNINTHNNDIVNIIANLISINKGLNKSELNALEILLLTGDIKGKDFKDYYCNKYKVSNSTAARALYGLVSRYIVIIDSNDIIKLNDKYKIKDKDINKIKVIIIETNN